MDSIEEPEPDDESQPMRDLALLVGGRCADCRIPYSAQEAVMSIALGFKNAPRCLACTGQRLAKPVAELRTQLTEYVHRRDCFLKAWREAERLDALSPQQLPSGAVIPFERKPADSEVTDRANATSATEQQAWDAGDMGCGELVMQLRMRLKKLTAGRVLLVTATDPAAPEDIPAWCRLCGHTLIEMSPPYYTIQRKED